MQRNIRKHETVKEYFEVAFEKIQLDSLLCYSKVVNENPRYLYILL